MELLSAPRRIDAAAFRKQVNGLQPKGMTPISASVRQGAEALKFTERKATIILVRPKSEKKQGCADDMPSGWDRRVRSGKCSQRSGITLCSDRAREGDSEWINEGESKPKLSGKGRSYIFVGTYGDVPDTIK